MNKSALLLPLSCYDESGMVKPPRWLYVGLLLLCCDWLLLLFSLASRSQTSHLLTIFYPDARVLGLRLICTLPLLFSMLLVSNRERLWKRKMTTWRKCIKPCLFVGLAVIIFAQLATLATGYWEFHWYPALLLLSTLVVFVGILRSRHLRLMIKDWRHLPGDKKVENATDDGFATPDQNTPSH